ncbi:AAA family ATPase [Nonomuraea sp. NPDC059007]|uniref:AAA family ATPase n=1 Tax=Nonomuraea sp. NPDC059007 TaxID=3346692 RepID=UPI00368E802D
MYPLVGREHILSVLVGHLNATLHGSGGCIILEGPIGIGRTRILKATALEGAERGLTVAYMRTGVIDQPTPARELVTFLRHIMSSESEFEDLVRPEVNPFWLADRLRELIEKAARRRPLLIVLDDAQRADEASALALQSLVQSLAASPVLWLLARRPVPAQSLAQHAIGWLIDRAAVRLHLGPLGDEAVAALCTNALGAKPDASVLTWAARCGGNPWLLENLLCALMEAGQVVIADGTASVFADRLPACVLVAVDRLLDELSHPVRRLLTQGRRIGHAFTAEEAAALLSEPAPNLSASVEEAIQAGFIRRTGEKLAFVHEVIDEALQQGSIASLDSAAPPGNSPTHADPAWTDRPVIQVPPQQRVCSCDEIVALVISAVVQLPNGTRTLSRAVGLLAGAGRGAEAGRLADVALRTGVEAAAEVQLVLELAQGLQDAGDHGILAEPLQRTLARQDLREFDRAKLERLLTDTAKHARPEGARDSRRTVVNGPRLGSEDRCERPLWTWMVRALIAADQFDEASAVCAAIKQESERLGAAWPEPLWHSHHAELLVTGGRLDEARVAAETGLRLSSRSTPEDSIHPRVVLARISLHHGDSATASEHLRMAERLVTDDTMADKAGLDWALTQFHAACGRPSMAVQTLINVEERVAPETLLFAEAPTAAATIVRLARKAGLSAEADQAAGFARRLTERNPTVASLAGGAEHAEGLLRGDLSALRRAVEHYRLSRRPLATGIALEDTAQEAQNTRDQDQAVRFLESALDLYLNCGARHDVTRVQRKLRRLGVTQAGSLGADRPTSGWESLTIAELRVVRAIVDGRTNKEAASILFLSPHTVDSHLRRVFAKLNINSRVELTKHFITHEAS